MTSRTGTPHRHSSSPHRHRRRPHPIPPAFPRPPTPPSSTPHVRQRRRSVLKQPRQLIISKIPYTCSPDKTVALTCLTKRNTTLFSSRHGRPDGPVPAAPRRRAVGVRAQVRRGCGRRARAALCRPERLGKGQHHALARHNGAQARVRRGAAQTGPIPGRERECEYGLEEATERGD